MSKFMSGRGRRWHAGVVVLAGIAVSAPAAAEFVLGAYGGFASTFDSDVDLYRADGTSLRYKDVSWTDESFTSPPYYGLRLGYWMERAPRWGLAAEFTHAKMVAELDRAVTVRGTRGGAAVDGVERLGDSFDNLEFSHGHNLLTLNGMYRWLPRDGRGGDTLAGRVFPYASLGAGVAIPHVEVATPDGGVTHDYQAVGPAFMGSLGLNVDLIPHLSLFGEYKLSYASMQVDLDDGGNLHVSPWTNHFVLGISLSY